MWLCAFYIAYMYIHRTRRLHIQAQCFSQEAKHDTKHHLNVPSCPKTTQTPSAHTSFVDHNTFDIIVFHIFSQ
jgi:hypothetical protein